MEILNIVIYNLNKIMLNEKIYHDVISP